ncbi:MAG TPA: ABC transporter substrate-binding protein [Baekduia sp.]|nr:ABC transporter substrate-binding protein [Baekduia sp.]
MKVGVTPVGDFAPIYYAVKQGIFKRHGLKVTIDPKGASEVPPLVSNSYQAVSMSWTTFIQATAQGVPLEAVFPGIDGEPDTQTGIYVKSSSGITSPQQLIGKKLAINQPKATFELNSRVALSANGIDASKVNYQVLPLPTIGDALLAGKVDAAYLVPPFSTIAESKGAKLLVDPYKTSQLAGSPVAGYAVTKDFAKKNPNTVKAFRDSLVEAANQLNASGSYRMFVTSFTSLTSALAKKVPAYRFPTQVDIPKLQKLADLMAGEKFATHKVDIKSFVVGTGQ